MFQPTAKDGGPSYQLYEKWVCAKTRDADAPLICCRLHHHLTHFSRSGYVQKRDTTVVVGCSITDYFAELERLWSRLHPI